MRHILPMYGTSTVNPQPVSLANIPNRDLSQKVIRHHNSNERELLNEAVLALFNRVVRPQLTPQHNQQNLTAHILLTHVMDTCVPQPQGSGTTSTQISVKQYVRNLAREVVMQRQASDNFETIQSAFNLLDNPTPEEIHHFNVAVQTENNRIDKVTSKIHLAGGIGTALLSLAQAIITNTSNKNTTTDQNNQSYSGSQMASLTVCALLLLIGGVHSSISTYQESKKVQPYQPDLSSMLRQRPN